MIRSPRLVLTSAGALSQNRASVCGSYRARSARSRLLLYGLVFAVTLWLIGPFVWLFVTSVSYQRNLLARPLCRSSRPR